MGESTSAVHQSRTIARDRPAGRAVAQAGPTDDHLLALQRGLGNGFLGRRAVSAPDDAAEWHAQAQASSVLTDPPTAVLAADRTAGPPVPFLPAGVAPSVAERAGAGRPLDSAIRMFLEPRLTELLPIEPSSSANPMPARADEHMSRPGDIEERQAASVTLSVRDPPVAGFHPTVSIFDFSGVRIHTDTHAALLARAADARAYTVGRDIVFGAGQYAPETLAGMQLIAHELVHVAQQGGSGLAKPTRLFRQAQTDTTHAPSNPLQKALEGDDDDVRALTADSRWSAITVSPVEAVTLLIHLLDGPTLDEDELAGLSILRKCIAQAMLDDALTELHGRNRFGQLFDDYDGKEYVELIDLLAHNISARGVKELFLDKFISMWWVNRDEEQAIVILLKRTTVADLVSLLVPQNREEELRTAIDNDALSREYEGLASKVDEQRQLALSAQLRGIFDVRAKAEVAKGARTEAEVDRLLKAAAADLASELAEYKTRLKDATTRGAGAVAEVNQWFERRLDHLLQQKSAEFSVELKWNFEFNRDLKKGYERSWTRDDLDEIDKILSKIPSDVLRANPALQRFLRAEEHPKKAGHTSSPGEEIVLFGELTLATTAHELGHVISFQDHDRLQKEWNAATGWEYITTAEINRDIPDQDERKHLLAELDDDRKDDDKYDSHPHGNFYYHYNRYDGPEYCRYPKSACFVSPYAKTDPLDDFAESFSLYLTDPKELHEKCPDKYKFMHEKVFVPYQRASVLKQFDDAADAGLTSAFDLEIRLYLRTQYIDKLRTSLTTALDEMSKKIGLANTGKLQPGPLRGTEARSVGRPFLDQLHDLLALAQPIAAKLDEFSSEAHILRAFTPTAQHPAFDALLTALSDEYRKDLIGLLNPLAQRVLNGDHVVQAAWPSLDELAKRYIQSLIVMGDYVAVFGRASTRATELGSPAWGVMSGAFELLAKFGPGDPRRERLRRYLVDQRNALVGELKREQSEVLARVKSGRKFHRSDLLDPEALFRKFQRDVEAYARTLEKARR